jgi:hypothetical protein
VDDPKVAAEEILRGLEEKGGLLKNTVGIVHCYPDFVETGALRAVCEALPFDTAGVTTMSLSAPGIVSTIGLTVSALTSDDVMFSSGVSESTRGDMQSAVGGLCKRVVSKLPGEPKLLLAYVPFLMSTGGDEFLAEIDKHTGGLPVFGTLPISDEEDYSNSLTIYNGVAYEDALVLIGLAGDVEPAFLCTSVHTDSILSPEGVVTMSDRNILGEINSMPVEDYFESIGLSERGHLEALVSTPFLAELPDGSTVTRCCFGSDGGGGAVLGGNIPEGARLNFAVLSPNDVISTTSAMVKKALAGHRDGGALMYSCCARNWSLGINATAEHEAVADIAGDDMPWTMAYSGGELFPQQHADGFFNRMQNSSMIVCLL